MNWARSLPAGVSLAALLGPLRAAAVDPTLESRRADFAELQTTVAEQYVYLDGKHAWWSVGDRVERIGTRTVAAAIDERPGSAVDARDPVARQCQMATTTRS